jgi:hypothetical protein
MNREKIEKLGTLFMAIFSGGLALQLATAGMNPVQWVGAGVAVAGSLGLAFAVRRWPEPAKVEVRSRD